MQDCIYPVLGSKHGLNRFWQIFAGLCHFSPVVEVCLVDVHAGHVVGEVVLGQRTLALQHKPIASALLGHRLHKVKVGTHTATIVHMQ